MAVEYLDYDGNEFVEGFYHGLKGVEDICYVSKVDEGWDCINLDGSSFVLNSGNNKASRCFIRVPDVERLEAETWFDIDGLREKADKLEKVMRFVGRGGRSGEDSGERGDEGSGYRCGDVGKDLWGWDGGGNRGGDYGIGCGGCFGDGCGDDDDDGGDGEDGGKGKCWKPEFGDDRD